MDIDKAVQLGDLMETGSTENYTLVKSLTDQLPLENFHQWADGKNCEGAFFVANQYKQAYWFMLIEWNDWSRAGDYYLIIYPENRSGPKVEIDSLEPDEARGLRLYWKYKPAKRDGRNEERKDYFEKFYLSKEALISFPTTLAELNDFYGEIFKLVEVRLKADDLAEEEPAFRDSFPEGKRVERMHIARERNPKVVALAKKLFLEKHHALFCEACAFNFEETYGEYGTGFIEAHHTVPVSELHHEGAETKVEDIALLCSNCHRIVHRRRPWLTMGELGELVAK